MLTRQKEWIDLFGSDIRNVRVEGLYIVRINGNARTILWHFDTRGQANLAFDEWIAAVESK